MAETEKNKRAEINLGDLLRAFENIKPQNNTQRNEILRCLGFHTSRVYSPVQQYRSSQAAWNRNRIRKKKEPVQLAKNAPKPSLPPITETPIELPKEALPSELKSLPDASSDEVSSELDIPEDITNTRLLIDDTKQLTPPPRLKLFPQQRARAIVSAAIAERVEGRDLDIQYLIKAMVEKKPLHSVPRLPQITIRNGCQLLVDFSDALMPWWQDMRDLIEQFRALLDEPLCKIYEFDNDPLSAIHWSEQKGDIAWKPEKDKPVIIATDLGITRHSSLGLRPGVETWFRLAQRCHRIGAPLTAVVPISPNLWPKGLDKWMRIIHWHPQTSAAIVNRLLSQRQYAR